MAKLTAAQINRGKHLPPRLINIGREVEAKVSKFETYEIKAADMAVSIKQLLAEAATYCDRGGFNAFRKTHCPSLGKSRAYELLAIASGRKTVEQSKAQGRVRQARHVAKLKAVASAMRPHSGGMRGHGMPSVSDGNSQFSRFVLELVLLTATASPAEFVSTTANTDDLRKLGDFLIAVAGAQRPKLRVV
jgi:hypothetical protein